MNYTVIFYIPVFRVNINVGKGLGWGWWYMNTCKKGQYQLQGVVNVRGGVSFIVSFGVGIVGTGQLL